MHAERVHAEEIFYHVHDKIGVPAAHDRYDAIEAGASGVLRIDVDDALKNFKARFPIQCVLFLMHGAAGANALVIEDQAIRMVLGIKTALAIFHVWRLEVLRSISNRRS